MRPDDSGRRACAVVPLPQSMLELRFAQAGPWWEGQINAELFEAMLRRPLRRAARWWRSRCGPGTVTKHSPPAPGRRSADPRAQRIVDDVSASRAFRAVAHLARDVPAERSGRMEEHHAIRTPRRDRRGNACSPGRMPSHNCRRSAAGPCRRTATRTGRWASCRPAESGGCGYGRRTSRQARLAGSLPGSGARWSRQSSPSASSGVSRRV